MNHYELVEMRLLELLSDRPSDVAAFAIAMRKQVLKLTGQCSEMLYRTYAVSNVFTFTGKLGQGFVHIATYGGHVNLGFNQGVDLQDPQGLLEGTGKRIRHVRIDSLKMIKSPSVKKLVVQAVDQGREMAEKAGGVIDPIFVDKSKS